MKRVSCFHIGCAALLLLASCNDDSGDHEKKTPPEYTLVSVEYVILESLPLRERLSSKVYANYSNAEITYISGDEEFPVNSYFLRPGGRPDDAEYIGRIEVPVPRLDASGNQAGLSDLKFPLAFAKTQTAYIKVKNPEPVVVPPFTTYKRFAYYVGWHISARYTCILEDTDTKDKTTIEGTWTGDVCYRQEVQVTDGENNPVLRFEHSVVY